MLQVSIAVTMIKSMLCVSLLTSDYADSGYAKIDSIFGKECSICGINLKRMWCNYNCSPRNYDFSKLKIFLILRSSHWLPNNLRHKIHGANIHSRPRHGMRYLRILPQDILHLPSFNLVFKSLPRLPWFQRQGRVRCHHLV